MAISPTMIPALSDPPDSDDADNFDDRGDEFFDELRDEFQPAANQQALDSYGNALICEEAAAGMLDATALASTSTTSLTIGENTSKSLVFAEASRLYQKGQWVNVAYATDPTQAMAGRITAVDNTAKTMTVFVPTGGADGAGTYASWIVSVSSKMGAAGDEVSRLVPVLAVAGAKTLAVTDRSKVLEYTGTGGDTWAGDIGVVGADFAFEVLHSGTGVLKLNFTQNIDAKDEIWVYPGESFAVRTSATLWKTIGRSRGPVLISRTVVGAAVASVDAEAGFGDTEFSRFDLIGQGVSNSTLGASTAPLLRLKKGGSYLATNYASGGFNASGTGSSGSLSSGFDVTNANTGAASNALNFRAQLLGASSALASGQLVTITGQEAGTIWSAHGTQSDTGAVQGVRFIFQTGNVDAGTFEFYGYR